MTIQTKKTAFLGASALALSVAGAVAIAAPRAGETIGNQAAATYTSGGQSYSVQSNVVETTVAEVYGVELVDDATRRATPGGFVFFPHTVTNAANTPDGFDLTTLIANGTPVENVLIYADANQDGQPDGAPITATTALQPGASFPFLIRGTVPAGAAPGDTGTFTITATSQADAANTFDTNTDTVTVTAGAVVSLIKDQTIVVDQGAPGASEGDTVEVVLTYNNTGGATAQNVSFTDQLKAVNDQGEAITLTYVAGSGVWSDGGTLDDADDGVDHTSGTTTIDYGFDASAGVNQMSAVINQIPQGRRGTITFRYVLTDVAEGGVENVANVAIDGDAPTPSNTSVIDIDAAYAVGVSDSQLSFTGGSAVGAAGSTYVAGGVESRTDDQADKANDVVVEDTNANPGDEIAFEVVMANLADVDDVFVLSADNTAFAGGTPFPAGTTFRYTYEDGQTAIVGNRLALSAQGAANGNDVARIRLIATLPTNAAGTNGQPAGYEAQVVATSENNPNAATGTDRAGVRFNGQVVRSVVDLTIAGLGVGPDPDDNGNPFVTEGVRPGEEVSFPLSIAYATGADTAFELTAPLVPQGWTVRFENAAGDTITTSDVLTAGDTFAYTAIVTAPLGAPADADQVFDAAFDFAIASTLTGAQDQVKAGADVDEVADLSIEAPTSVQIAPGGVGIVAHTVTNRGNSGVDDWTVSFGDDDFTDAGYTAALFYDTNGDGVFTAGTDLAATRANLPDLAIGETATVFVRVQVPEGAPVGQVETGDVVVDLISTANDADTAPNSGKDQVAANNAVTDTVRIVAGDVTLAKSQALDAACDGAADTPFGATSFDVLPGQCVAYRIVADNTGNAAASAVVMTDNTPSFTAYEACAGNACAASFSGPTGVSATTPAAGQAGTVATTPGFTLAPGEAATLSFTVRVDG